MDVDRSADLDGNDKFIGPAIAPRLITCITPPPNSRPWPMLEIAYGLTKKGESMNIDLTTILVIAGAIIAGVVLSRFMRTRSK
jgi:hypothetical protein